MNEYSFSCILWFAVQTYTVTVLLLGGLSVLNILKNTVTVVHSVLANNDVNIESSQLLLTLITMPGFTRKWFCGCLNCLCAAVPGS